MRESDKPFPNRRYITVELAIEELMYYCQEVDWVEYQPAIEFLQNYLDLLPKEQHTDYRERVYKMLEFDYKWKMPVKSDLLRIDLELERQIGLYGKWTWVKNENGVRSFQPLLRIDKVQSPAIKKSKIDVEEILKELDLPAGVKDPTDFKENTVDEYLEHFKGSAINSGDYDIIVNVLSAFFNEKPLPKYKPVFVKYGNKKKLGSALHALYKALKIEVLSYEYLDLCRRLFQCYADEVIDKTVLNKSNLHKYFTTKSQY